MEDAVIRRLVLEGKSTREIGEVLGVSQTSVLYWLKKLSIKTQYPTPTTEYRCGKCGDSEKGNFYKSQKWLCSSCFNQYKIDIGYKRRILAIEKLGGKCSNPDCGYDKYRCALDIHHLDPKKKDPNFNGMRGWSIKRLEKELAGCVLLCKNCHSAFHAGELILNLIPAFRSCNSTG